MRKLFLYNFIFVILIITSIFLYSNKYVYKDNKIIEGENMLSKDISVNNYNIVKPYEKVSEIIGVREDIGFSKKGYTIYKINGVTYIDSYMIVNKTYNLPSDFYPTNTHIEALNIENTCNSCINEIAYNAWQDMKSDALSLGLNIYISSGYRPYITQQKIYDSYVLRDGIEVADTYSARAGYSEHQTGLAFDLNSISDSFADTEEGKWINNNAYIYGFILRYPKDKTNETGYKYEPWHLRYVGTELSYKLYNNGDWITLEDYFGITSEYE